MRMLRHEKQTTWRGSVTVFFSLTGVLVLCVLLAVVEAVRMQGAKAQTASLEGVANFSVLAEYEKNFGPLTVGGVDDNADSWTWIQGPWPWELEA